MLTGVGALALPIAALRITGSVPVIKNLLAAERPDVPELTPIPTDEPRRTSSCGPSTLGQGSVDPGHSHLSWPPSY